MGRISKEQLDRIQTDQDFDAYFKRFIADTAQECYTCRLSSRKEHPKYKNREIFGYLAEWENTIPGYNDVASRFGGGDYRLEVIFQTEDGKQEKRSHDFHIDQRFMPPAGAQVPAIAAAPSMSGSAGSRDLIEIILTQQTAMMNNVFGLLTAVITAQSKNNPISEAMQPLFEGFQTMMVHSARNTMDIVSDFSRKMLQIPEEPEEQEEPAGDFAGIIDAVKTFWTQYARPILAATKSQQTFYAKQVRNTDMYKQLSENPELFAAAYDELCKTAPVEKVNQLLSVLGLEVPGPESAAAEGGN